MSAIAALTLLDGQSTPVSHTFSPVRIDSEGVARWADRVGGISIGFPVITLSVRSPNKTSRTFKVSAKIVTPILEVTSPSTATGIQPAPTLAYPLIATIEFILPERSSLAQRKDIYAYVKNFFANANLVNAVENFENVY